MTVRTGNGTAMQAHKFYWRILPKNTPGPVTGAALQGRIVEVRKLLRTDLSIEKIAEQLGCDRVTLRSFIRRHRLCNLKERRDFITLQASLAKPERGASR